MAIVKEIIIKADAEDAMTETEKLTNAIDKLSGEVSGLGKDFEETADKSKKSTSKISKGFKAVGTAFKTIGLGIVIALFAKLTEVLSKNQKVMDIFSNVMKSLEIAFKDLFDFVTSNFIPAFEKVKAFFENLTFDKIKKAIQKDLIERFQSALEVVGFLGDAMVKFFKGDFAGSLDSVKEAGKELVDVVTGVDDTVGKVTETVTKAVKSITSYAKETYSAADAITELGNRALLAQAVNQGLIEKYDRQAEQQRQIRDDEFRSMEDRIAANNKLGEILEEQEKTMLKNAELSIAAAANELALNDNIENQIALIEAKNEKMAIQAQVEGFRSEQLINTNSLLREQGEIEQAALDAIIANEAEKKKIRDKAAAEEIAQDKAVAAAKKGIRESNISSVAGGLSLLAALGKKSAALQAAALIGEHGANIAKQIISTQAANAGALATPQAILTSGASAIPVIAANKLNLGLGLAASGIALGKGLASLKQSGGGGSSSPSGGASGGGAPAPSFSLVEGTGSSQIAESLQNQKTPLKAYVVSGDVSNAQALDRNIINNSSL